MIKQPRRFPIFGDKLNDVDGIVAIGNGKNNMPYIYCRDEKVKQIVEEKIIGIKAKVVVSGEFKPL